MILVDTNVWSELTKRQSNPRVVAWLAANQADLRLSALVIAEVRLGCELPRARPIRPMLLAWLGGLEEAYAGRIEVFDERDAHVFGRLAAGRMSDGSLFDLQLAAQAIVRGMAIATRNVRDFAWTGVDVIDPWSQAGLTHP
ncbi:MAG: PIN domain-containing protein [Novosphingobium sp.]